MRAGSVSCQGLQIASGRFRHVEERTKRRGREKRVTCAGQETYLAGKLIGETPDQRCLSHTGFSADENQPPARGFGDRFQLAAERVQLLRAFK
jgi:hypothetical protein